MTVWVPPPHTHTHTHIPPTIGRLAWCALRCALHSGRPSTISTWTTRPLRCDVPRPRALTALLGSGDDERSNTMLVSRWMDDLSCGDKQAHERSEAAAPISSDEAGEEWRCNPLCWPPQDAYGREAVYLSAASPSPARVSRRQAHVLVGSKADTATAHVETLRLGVTPQVGCASTA